MIDLAIIAPVCLYAEGLALIVDRDARFRVVGTAGTLAAALDLLGEQAGRPKVVLVDVATPDGLSGLRALRDAVPGVRVIALAVGEVEHDVIAWAEAGAAGFVVHDASCEDLCRAVAGAARDETVCTPWITSTLLRHVASQARDPADADPTHALTAREREVVALIEQGLSNKEIAREMRIEVPTVKNHVHHLLEKLSVRRRGEAAALLRGETARRRELAPDLRLAPPAIRGIGSAHVARDTPQERT